MQITPSLIQIFSIQLLSLSFGLVAVEGAEMLCIQLLIQ